jgi:hypothetical protein
VYIGVTVVVVVIVIVRMIVIIMIVVISVANMTDAVVVTQIVLYNSSCVQFVFAFEILK